MLVRLRRHNIEVGFGLVEKQQKSHQVDAAAAGFKIIGENGFLDAGLTHEHFQEKDRFHWPEDEADVIDIQGRELSWLLDGLHLDQRAAH